MFSFLVLALQSCCLELSVVEELEVVLLCETFLLVEAYFCSSVPTMWNSLLHKLKDSDSSKIEFKAGYKAWFFEHVYA